MLDERLRLYIAKRIHGLLAGDHTSRQFSSRGYDLEEKRDFKLGDDFRAIDPISTFKRGEDSKPRISVRKVEKGANIYFFIDCSPSMRFGVFSEKYSESIDLASNISMASLGSGNRFRFLAFDRKIPYDSGFLTSGHGIEEAANELKKIKSLSGITNLHAPVDFLLNVAEESPLNRPGLVFIISDLFIETNDQIRKLAEVGEQSDILVMVMRDPTEMVLPTPGLGFARLTDPETGKTFLAKNPGHNLDSMVPILKKYEIGFLELQTGNQEMNFKNLIDLFEGKRSD